MPTGSRTTRRATAALSVLSLFAVASAGASHVAATAAPVTVFNWGDNGSGQLGNGATSGTVTRPLGIPSLTNVKQVGGGEDLGLALKTDGSVWSWGNADAGRLGNGVSADQNFLQIAPVHGFNNSGTLQGVSQISAGDESVVALRGGGGVVTWGDNGTGQLGRGNHSDSPYPVMVQGLPDIRMVRMLAKSAIVVGVDGSVWTWGDNGAGQGGDGTVSNDNDLPHHVSGITGAVAASTGLNHSLALKGDGTVWAWGSNVGGELGTGNHTDHLLPVQVPGIGGVVAVAQTFTASFALKGDGTLWAWGMNDAGQQGDGSGNNAVSPHRVPGLTNIVSVAANGEHVLAVQSDGSLWSWGQNSTGQVGDGTVATRRTPTRIMGGVAYAAATTENSRILLSAGTPPPSGTPRPTARPSATAVPDDEHAASPPPPGSFPGTPAAGSGGVVPGGGTSGSPEATSAYHGSSDGSAQSAGNEAAAAPALPDLRALGGDAGVLAATVGDPRLVPVAGTDPEPGLIAGFFLERHPIVTWTLVGLATLMLIALAVMSGPARLRRLLPRQPAQRR
jgi:alpha-tubulin suppressor-like RCC1 family protein